MDNGGLIDLAGGFFDFDNGLPTGTALAMGGAGLAHLPEPCVAPLLHAGDLRLVLEDWSPIGPGFHLYHPGRRQLPTSLRLLIDLVREIKHDEQGSSSR